LIAIAALATGSGTTMSLQVEPQIRFNGALYAPDLVDGLERLAKMPARASV